MQICEKCGGKDIEKLVWVKVNTNEVCGDGPHHIDFQWCCNCQEHVQFKTKFKNSMENVIKLLDHIDYPDAE